MAAYHVVLIHFPIALWMAATLMILLRVLNSGAIGLVMDRALPVFLGLGVVAGVLAWVAGFLSWDWTAISSTPMGRNHMLTASWSLAYFTVLAWLRIVHGEAIWQGLARWLMLLLAGIGVVLVGITGTLGGHLVGVYTDLGQILRRLGWDIYTTFYVPDMMLIALGAAIVALLAVAVMGRRAPQA